MTERYEKDYQDAMYEIEAEAMKDSEEALSTASVSKEVIGDKPKSMVLLEKLLDPNLTKAQIDKLLREAIEEKPLIVHLTDAEIEELRQRKAAERQLLFGNLSDVEINEKYENIHLSMVPLSAEILRKTTTALDTTEEHKELDRRLSELEQLSAFIKERKAERNGN